MYQNFQAQQNNLSFGGTVRKHLFRAEPVRSMRMGTYATRWPMAGTAGSQLRVMGLALVAGAGVARRIRATSELRLVTGVVDLYPGFMKICGRLRKVGGGKSGLNAVDSKRGEAGKCRWL